YNMRFPWQPRAKTFMGNAGSAWLGMVVAWVVFRLTQNSGHPVNPVLALWLLPIPVMDCLVLTVRRTRQGRSPFAAGRDHIHHFMQDAGFGPTQAALALTAFSVLTGLVAGQLMRLDVPNAVILLGFLTLCVGWYALSSNRARTGRFFAVLRALPVFGPVPARAAQRGGEHAHTRHAGHGAKGSGSKGTGSQGQHSAQASHGHSPPQAEATRRTQAERERLRNVA